MELSLSKIVLGKFRYGARPHEHRPREVSYGTRSSRDHLWEFDIGSIKVGDSFVSSISFDIM